LSFKLQFFQLRLLLLLEAEVLSPVFAVELRADSDDNRKNHGGNELLLAQSVGHGESL
jgi:hypothetical protein